MAPLSAGCTCKAIAVAAELRCGSEPLGLTFDARGMIGAIDPGAWAETHGIQVGDQLLAIDGASVDRWAQQQRGSSFTLMGPQRVVVQFHATREEVKQAFRSVSSSASQRERFREALRDEAERFEFREQLQQQLRLWRPRELWPFPGLPPKAVDPAAELRRVLRKDGTSEGRQPRIKEMDAAARKLQSLFRWRKLWAELDTSQERDAAARKIQSRHPDQPVRKGLAAEFAAANPDELKEPETPEVLPEALSRRTSQSVEVETPAPASRRSSADNTVQLHLATAWPAEAVPPSQAAMLGFFDGPDPVVEAASVKIQALERGRQQRKKFKEAKEAKEGTQEAQEAPEPEESEEKIFAPALQGDEAFEAQDEELELPAPSTEVPVNQATFMDFGPTDLVLEEPEGIAEVAAPDREADGEGEATLSAPVDLEVAVGPAVDAEISADPPSPDIVQSSVDPVPEPPERSLFPLAAPSIEPQETRKVPAKPRSKGFKLAPVNFGQGDLANVESPASPRPRSNGSDGLPDNTLDFMEETQNAQLVSQSTLKFPKPKKSPRAKAEKIQPLIRPTVTPAASASASKPEVGPEPAKEATPAASMLGPSPTEALPLASFRIPKDRSKEDRDESKSKKKKKKKKDKKEDDLDNFGFDIF